MYRVYECNRETGEEKLLYAHNSMAKCVDVKERLIKDSISSGDRFYKDGRVRITYTIAGEEGTPILRIFL